VNRLFTQGDWDFRWILSKPDKQLITAARHYECARQAVLEANLMLPLCDWLESPVSEVYWQYGDEHINKRRLFGPIWYLRFSEPCGPDFPLMPFQSVLPQLTDLDRFACELQRKSREYHDHPLINIDVPQGLSVEEATKFFLERYIREGGISPRRGAGALTRQHKTVLKYLAATRVLKYLGAQFAYSNDGATLQANGHCPLGAIVAEAKLLTTEVLGKPLLNSDQEWARAQTVIQGVMAEYQREIDWLRTVFSTAKF
jgi:hypothetical protein